MISNESKRMRFEIGSGFIQFKPVVNRQSVEVTCCFIHTSVAYATLILVHEMKSSTIGKTSWVLRYIHCYPWLCWPKSPEHDAVPHLRPSDRNLLRDSANCSLPTSLLFSKVLVQKSPSVCNDICAAFQCVRYAFAIELSLVLRQ
jgi:hypothetical protein